MITASADHRILEDNRSIEARSGCTYNIDAVYHSNKLLSTILQTSSSAEALEGSIPSMMKKSKCTPTRTPPHTSCNCTS